MVLGSRMVHLMLIACRPSIKHFAPFSGIGISFLEKMRLVYLFICAPSSTGRLLRTFQACFVAQQVILLVVDLDAQRLTNVVVGIGLVEDGVVGFLVLMQLKALLNVYFHFAQFGHFVQTPDRLLPLFVYVDGGRRFGELFALELNNVARSL